MADENWQELCDSLYNETQGILACYVVDVKGKILGRNFGRIEAPADLRSKYGGIAAVLWGGLLNVEQIGGRLSMLTANFEKFKVLGIPLPGGKTSVLATVPVKTDPSAMKDVILAHVRNWRVRNPDS